VLTTLITAAAIAAVLFVLLVETFLVGRASASRPAPLEIFTLHKRGIRATGVLLAATVIAAAAFLAGRATAPSPVSEVRLEIEDTTPTPPVPLGPPCSIPGGLPCPDTLPPPAP
jgi:hypothetical protein